MKTNIVKSDLEIVKEYLDLMAQTWMTRASTAYYWKTHDIVGSSFADFLLSPTDIDLDSVINNFGDTVREAIHYDWPRGMPINSGYMEGPQYLRQLAKIVCDQNGLVRPLDSSEKRIIRQENELNKMFVKTYTRGYGLEQRLPFLVTWNNKKEK